MVSPWIEHVKQYAKDNNCSYHEALTNAGATYKKVSKKSTAASKITKVTTGGSQNFGGYDYSGPENGALPWEQKRDLQHIMPIRYAPTEASVSALLHKKLQERLANEDNNNDIDTLFMDFGDVLGSGMRMRGNKKLAKMLAAGILKGVKGN